MSKVAQRLLIFFIGIPVVLGIVFINFHHHLPLNVLLVAASGIAAWELYRLFETKSALLPKLLIIILSLIQPLISYLLIEFNLCGANSSDYSSWMFLFAAMILMATEVFSHKTFEESNKRLSASVFIVFYCGYLFTFITRMTLLEKSTHYISLFLFTVFINDSLAWLFGVLFGKNNRGVFAASPNKSIAGFSGGIAGAIASCVLAMYFFPEVFAGGYWKGILLGLICGISGITGDLIESVFKRSGEIKDSGNIIPGRGGILDSIDSILFTAPVFYVVSYFLFHPVLFIK